jgi:EsV-1-7 cysteine-rich motif
MRYMQSVPLTALATLIMQARRYCLHHAVDAGAAVFVGTAALCRNHEVCSKRASFGYKGQPPIYCKACIPEKLQGKLISVVNKFCEVEGCGTRPSFGKPGDTVSALFTAVVLFCAPHNLLNKLLNAERTSAPL